jgi:hypothetical protein
MNQLPYFQPQTIDLLLQLLNQLVPVKYDYLASLHRMLLTYFITDFGSVSWTVAQFKQKVETYTNQNLLQE